MPDRLTGMPAHELEYTSALRRYHWLAARGRVAEAIAVRPRIEAARLHLQGLGYDGDHLRHLTEVGMPEQEWIAMIAPAEGAAA